MRRLRGDAIVTVAQAADLWCRHNGRRHLTIDVTIDDAKVYTRPWSTTIRLIAVPDTEMLDAQYLENEKDVPHLLNAK